MGPRQWPRSLPLGIELAAARTRLLEDAERSLLEVLAVFTDGWTIQAAAQVAGPEEYWALELSEALARHSLVYLCAAPARAGGWSGWTPRQATWPRRCAGTWPMTRGRCRTCSGSCGCSGRSGTLRARPGHELSSSGAPPARWTCRPAPSLRWWRR